MPCVNWFQWNTARMVAMKKIHQEKGKAAKTNRTHKIPIYVHISWFTARFAYFHHKFSHYAMHGGETFRNEPRTGSNRSTFIELSQRKRVSIKQHRDTIWQMQHNDVSRLKALLFARVVSLQCVCTFVTYAAIRSAICWPQMCKFCSLSQFEK